MTSASSKELVLRQKSTGIITKVPGGMARQGGPLIFAVRNALVVPVLQQSAVCCRIRRQGVKEMPAYFPIFISMEQKKVRIFGAGKIAARRARALLRYGASVRVTALHIGEEIQELCREYPLQMQTEQRTYRAGGIQREEADFVLAATDDREANACICQECRQKGIPVNNASDSSQCDFFFPALIEKDDLVIGVTSTDGDHRKTAAFSEKLRRQS